VIVGLGVSEGLTEGVTEGVGVTAAEGGTVSAKLCCTTYKPTIIHNAVKDSSMIRLGDSPFTISDLLRDDRLSDFRLIQGLNISVLYAKNLPFGRFLNNPAPCYFPPEEYHRRSGS
jgi:hypothetical protein